MQSNTRRPTLNGLDFGATVDSPSINFIPAIDLNGEDIRIPYDNYEVTFDNLLRNYLDHSSCRDKIKGEPYFQVLNGPFKNQIAVKQYKVSSMSLNLQEPCLKVVNKKADFQGAVNKSLIKFQAINSLVIVPIKLLIEGKQIKHSINNKDTVLKLKASLLNTLPELKSYNLQSIKLMHNGFVLFNENSELKTYGITKDSIVSVVIKKNQGCFKKTCLITCGGNRKVPISELKTGDTILSYNSQKKQLEQDKIVYIHTTVLQQSILIKLQNGEQIETTSNHRFLCSDYQYRMVQFSLRAEQMLKQGSILKLGDGTEAAIQSISTKAVHPAQQFYHLCIENNHNFVVDNFIAHNMYINLKISKEQTERMDVNPTESIAGIKQKLEPIYYKSMKSIKILFAGKELRDQCTLSDSNIAKDSTLNVSSKKSEKFNYVFGTTKVLKYSGKQGKYVPISTIKTGDEIVTYDPIANRRSQMPGRVVKVTTLETRDFMKIYLDSIHNYVMVHPDSYLQLSDGRAMHVKDICDITDGRRPHLKNIEGKDFTIYAMSPDKHDMAETFYRLQLDYSSNYIIQGAIIHNLVLNFAIKRNNSVPLRVSFGANSDTTVQQVKKKMQLITKIPHMEQVFTFNNKQLENQNQILQYKLQTQHLIVVTLNEYSIGKSSILLDQQQIQNFNNKKILLSFSPKEQIIINYHLYAMRTVEEIVKELVPNCKSSYVLVFDQLLIYPQQLLLRLQESESFKLSENVVIVVKNDKLSFIQNMTLQKQHIQSHSHIIFDVPIPAFNQNSQNRSQIIVKSPKKKSQLFVDTISRISQIQKNQYKRQRFYQPFLYYTSHDHNRQIYQFIRNFDVHRSEVNKLDSTYSIIKNLYVNMHLLPNYVGTCFLGLRNFKFNKFFKQNQVFYWHSFTSARKKDNDITNDLKGQVGTLFHINSLTGKQISQFSLYPGELEILFSPFSYFLVVKIEKGDYIDEVWLDEIPSPVTFQKNIILWVDDKPMDKANLNLKIMMELDNIEVIQLTSTLMAQKWMKEFGWLLNWKGIQFKLISNMRRYEGLPRQLKQQAGIDLLQCLYNLNGFTAKTLIFCGNKQRALQALEKAKARRITQSKYQVTALQEVVEKFAKSG